MPGMAPEIVLDPAELRRIAYRGQVRRYNKKDVFGLVGRHLSEFRYRIKRWSDDEYRANFARHKSTALCKTLHVLDIEWDPNFYKDPFMLPQGHNWDPEPEQVMDLLVFCVFDTQNPETRLQQVTGNSPQAEYNLRKCIAYDAIEYKGNCGMLLEAWESGTEPPRVDPVTGVVPERTAPGATRKLKPIRGPEVVRRA